MVTAGGLTFIGATNDRMFRAFDSRTGEELWAAAFDYNVQAVPMTYEGSDGKQYVAVNVSAPATAEPRGNERLVVFGLAGPVASAIRRFQRLRSSAKGATRDGSSRRRYVASLNHPNITDVHGIDETGT